jgi:hypothetical protein
MIAPAPAPIPIFVASSPLVRALGQIGSWWGHVDTSDFYTYITDV